MTDSSDIARSFAKMFDFYNPKVYTKPRVHCESQLFRIGLFSFNVGNENLERAPGPLRSHSRMEDARETAHPDAIATTIKRKTMGIGKSDSF